MSEGAICHPTPHVPSPAPPMFSPTAPLQDDLGHALLPLQLTAPELLQPWVEVLRLQHSPLAGV